MKKTFIVIFLLLVFWGFTLSPVYSAYNSPDEAYWGYLWAESATLAYECFSGFFAPYYIGGFYVNTLTLNATWDNINDHLYMGAVWIGNEDLLDQGSDWAFTNANSFEMQYVPWDEMEYTTPVIAAGGYDTFLKTRGMNTDLTIDMRTFSDYNDSFIIQVYIIRNDTETDYTGLYFAEAVDFDINMQYSPEENVGIAQTYISDSASGYKEKDDFAGYNSTNQVGFMYDNDLGVPTYYGVKCLTDELASFNIIKVEPAYFNTGYLGGSYAGDDKGVYDIQFLYGFGWPLVCCSNPMQIYNADCYDYMSNGQFDTAPPNAGDYQVVPAVGPFDLGAGEYKIIAFALGGNVLTEAALITQFQNASVYYNINIDGHLDDAIPESAPVEEMVPYEIYNSTLAQTEAVFTWALDSNITGEYAGNSGYNVYYTIDWDIFVFIWIGNMPLELHSYLSDTLYQPSSLTFEGYSLVEGTEYTAGDSVQLWVTSVGPNWDNDTFVNQSKELIMDIDTTPLTPTLTLDLLPASSDGSDILLTWSEADTKDQDIKQYNIYRSSPGGGTSCPFEVATILTSTRIIDLYGPAGLDGGATPLLILSNGSTYRPSTYRPDYDTTPDSDTDPILNFSTEHFLLGGLETGTTYVFQVTLTDFTDLTANSDTVTTVMMPGTPLNLTATMGHHIVKLHWELSTDPNVFKYNVYRIKLSEVGAYYILSDFKLIGATLASSSKPWRYNDKDIEDHQEYLYFVTASDRIANLDSYVSNVVSVETSFRTSKDLEGVMTVPNPYKKGISTVDFIAFARLTKEAEINIYTLSGILIRTLTHSPAEVDPLGPGIEKWDLKNEDGEEVASGLYVWVVTNPAGDKKIGRLVIIR